MGFAAKALFTVGALVIAAAALKIMLGLLGAVVGFLGFLLFTVVPLAIIGWIVLKIFRKFRERPVTGT